MARYWYSFLEGTPESKLTKDYILKNLRSYHDYENNYDINDNEALFMQKYGITEDDLLEAYRADHNGLNPNEYSIYQSNQSQLNTQKNAIDKSLTDSNAIIDANVTAQKGILKNTYDTDVALLEADKAQRTADLDEAYEKNLQLVDTQRRFNERYLERKAAEMGSSNSGLNRTQITANQLSAGNAMNDYGVQRQKAIDILNAAVQAQRLQMDTNYNNNLAALDMDAANQKASLQLEADNAKAQLEADYINNARQTQSALYDQQTKAAAAEETARRNNFTETCNFLKDLDSDDDTDRLNSVKIIDNFLNQYDPKGAYGYGEKLLTIMNMTLEEYETLLGQIYGIEESENKKSISQVTDLYDFILEKLRRRK
jgi:hypothetical protein